MQSTPPSIVFQSNLQRVLADRTKLKETNKLRSAVKKLKKYVHSQGSLDDCYELLVGFFKTMALVQVSVNPETREESQFIFDSIESEELLFVVLSSPQFQPKQALKHFDYDTMKLVMRTFQLHCGKMAPTSEGVSRKNLWKAILHQSYLKLYTYRERIYKMSCEFLVYIAKSGRDTKLQDQQIKHLMHRKSDPAGSDAAQEAYLSGFFSAACLLEIMAAIIQGFNTPMRPFHVEHLLKNVLMPLHSNGLMKDDIAPALTIYHSELSFCIVSFCKKDPKLTLQLLRRILLLIPPMVKKGESKQAVLLINEVEQLFDILPDDQFPSIQREFFTSMSNCFDNLNYAVVQRSLLILNTPRLIHLCGSMLRKVEMDIVPLLLNTASEHWNDSSRQMAYQALMSLSKLPNSTIGKNRNFLLIHESFKQRFENEELQEATKQQRMLQPKENLRILQFVFIKKLGEGSYSDVHHVRRIDHSVSQLYWEDYALKIMEKNLLHSENYYDNATQEIRLLQNQLSDHPNIIKLIGTFEEPKKLYAVLQFAEKGDLFHVLDRLGTVEVGYGRFVMAQICLGLHYIHEAGYVHLDIKPENVLITHNGYLKLTDFGSVVNYQKPQKSFQLQGTAEYLSPSLVGGNHPAPEDDVWAIGCLLFQLFAGTAPFNSDNKDKLFRLIQQRNLIFPASFPEDAKELVEMILNIGKPEYHPVSLEQVMAHRFFDSIDWVTINEQPAPQPTEGNIKAKAIDSNLRQRKYSMLVTQTLPRKYQFSNFNLEPIPETIPQDEDEDPMEEN